MALWGKEACLNVSIKYHSAVVDDEARKMYVFGGMTLQSPSFTNQVSKALFEYSFDSNTWVELECEGINGRCALQLCK